MMLNKVFVLIACGLVAVNAGISPGLKEAVFAKVTGFGKDCLSEVGANTDDMEEIMDHRYPSRHEGKCLIFCVQNKFGVVKDDGSMDVENTLKLMAPIKADDADLFDHFATITKECASSVPSDADKCNYGTDLALCAHKKIKDLGLDEWMFHN